MDWILIQLFQRVRNPWSTWSAYFLQIYIYIDHSKNINLFDCFVYYSIEKNDQNKISSIQSIESEFSLIWKMNENRIENLESSISNNKSPRIIHVSIRSPSKRAIHPLEQNRSVRLNILWRIISLNRVFLSIDHSTNWCQSINRSFTSTKFRWNIEPIWTCQWTTLWSTFSLTRIFHNHFENTKNSKIVFHLFF